MPEGDSLFRTAAGLRPHLVGRRVIAAKARTPGPRVERLVGQQIVAVEPLGKNLLIRFDGGLELRTHLRMHGTWHRYAPGEPWRRPAGRAVLALEVPGAVAVCFDAPVVELFETRAAMLHPGLGSLGPDLLGGTFDAAEALRRLADPARAGRTVAEALLDQRALAGIGNVYKSEVLFTERVDPFALVGELDRATLARLVDRARALLMANVGAPSRVTTGPEGGGVIRVATTAGAMSRTARHWVYRRAGRPCRRCGTLVQARRHGDLPRTTYWCPACQPATATTPRDNRAEVRDA